MNHSTPIKNNKREAGESQGEYRCPQCKSSPVLIGYPDIRCGACGWSELLIDFPISWDWHRHFSIFYSGVDPGTCEPPEYTLDELGERVKALEERFDGLSQEELKALGLKQLKEEVDQLRLGLRYTQRLIPRKPTKMKQPKRVVTTEV